MSQYFVGEWTNETLQDAAAALQKEIQYTPEEALNFCRYAQPPVNADQAMIMCACGDRNVTFLYANKRYLVFVSNDSQAGPFISIVDRLHKVLSHSLAEC